MGRKRTLLTVALAVSVLAATVHAGIIFQEDFESLTADATLLGQGGWTYDPAYGTDPLSNRSSSPDEAWVVTKTLTYTSPDSSIIIDGGQQAVRVLKHYDDPANPNDHVTKVGHKVAVHEVPDTPPGRDQDFGTIVYFSVLVQAGEAIGNSDNAHMTAGVWDSQDRWEKSTQLGEMSWNYGSGWVHGKGGSIHSSTSWTNSAVIDTSAKDTETHLLVGRLRKEWQWHDDPGLDDPDDGQYFTMFDVWIDPNAGDAATPDGTSKFLDSKVPQAHYISRLILDVENGMDLGDVIYFDNITMGQTWGDVIPEPTTAVLLLAGAVGLIRRRR